MKKIIFTFIVTTIFIFQFAPYSFGATHPQGDFKLLGARLAEESFNSENDPYRTFMYVTRRIPISIKQGKVSADGKNNFSYSLPELNQEFSGNGNIKIDGKYDPSSGLISGTFTYHHYEYNVKTMIGWDDTKRDGEGTIDIQGKITGKVLNDTSIIIYSGTSENNSKAQLADKSYKNYSSTDPITIKTIYSLTDEEESEVKFSAIKGQVEYRLASDQKSKWQLCKLNTRLTSGMMIRTREDSSAVLSFPDMSIFILKPETTVVIEKQTEQEGKIKLMAGRILANVKKIIKDGTVEIDMNQAICGIKGTIFEVEEENGVSSLKVHRGIVEFTSKTDDKTVYINQGEEISADNTGIKEKKIFDSQETQKELSEIDAFINSMQPENIKNAIDELMLDSNQSGNNSNLYLIGWVVGISALIVVSAILFKRKK